MITFSELTPSLTVTEFIINVEGLDYTVLGNKLEPTKDVIAINSNFIHKAFEADTVHTIRYFPKSG
ncbi:969_t:CDS:2, partial [Rhizophagus irregularis]